MSKVCRKTTEKSKCVTTTHGGFHHARMAGFGSGGHRDFVPELVSLTDKNSGRDNRAVIRLLIADDHELVRDGLRMTFEGTDVEIVLEAIDGQEAFDGLSGREIDVALVDISMPRADGFRFLQLARDAGVE